MRLTAKLLGFLNRVWDKDPHQFLALRLNYSGGGMTWQVADGVLTTSVSGDAAANLTVDLSQYTVSSLATYLAGQEGYTTSDVADAEWSGLSAEVLIDGSGDPATSNGDHLYGYTNPNWAVLDAYASELQLAETAIQAMPAEMSTATADGEWLDRQGDYYAVPRLLNELDPQYGPRIVATVLQPKSNNIAIATALAQATGQPATVTDVTIYKAGHPQYDAEINFDGSHLYNTGFVPVYGLFDASVGYDLLGASSPRDYIPRCIGVINALRAAGTQLRDLVLSGGTLTDTAAGPSDAGFLATLGVPLSDAATVPSDGMAMLPVRLSELDAFTAPGDPTDDLQVALATAYNGVRRFDGSRSYSSGYVVDETLSGTVNSVSNTLLLAPDGSMLTTGGGAFLTA